MEDMKKSIK